MKLSPSFGELKMNVLTALILTVFVMATAVVSKATISRHSDESSKRDDELKIHLSSNRLDSSIYME